AIARHATANLRLLRGALTRVVAVSSLTNTPITRDLVQEALPGVEAATPAASRLSAAAIQAAVCKQLGVDRDQLLSQSRTSAVVEARQLAMYLTRRHTDLSLPRIAREFNRRDHTTVMHALKRVESRLQTEPTMTQTLDQLSTALAS
ncbi:MAG: helix-turn-helix domain-containing protein, partial [Solirubrobacterales bacterium]